MAASHPYRLTRTHFIHDTLHKAGAIVHLQPHEVDDTMEKIVVASAKAEKIEVKKPGPSASRPKA